MPEMRIAMWSGPRNISTALLRAWENRADTVVVDEPFYAYYLARTGIPHPGAEEVIAAGETDWRKVSASLTGPIPHARPIFYQKQMTHHLLPEIARDWLDRVINCFLIRDPAEVIVSYARKNDDPLDDDIGFARQAEIFDWVCDRAGKIPPVIDARDVLENPEGMLRALCREIGAPFDPAMLAWPPGLRESDGIWAKHWYGEVAKSTGFTRPRGERAKIPERYREIDVRSRVHYDRLAQFRLTAPH
ncbi:MAG: sulfotransferase [Verrucomicrobiota bacterium]|nr:sulfotransferase [Verrucomicrobiota bacterium]